MDGYDNVKSNRFNPSGDPGITNRIFLHDCFEGYYDFVSDVRLNMNCQSDFSMKSITTTEEYNEERGSSNKESFGGGAEAGKKFSYIICIFLYLILAYKLFSIR